MTGSGGNLQLGWVAIFTGIRNVFRDSKIKQPKYWMEKLQLYDSRGMKDTVNIIEYSIKDTAYFEQPFHLEKRFLYQSVWYYLEDDFEIKHVPLLSELTAKIPGAVRWKIYNDYKLAGKSHLIDIDHHVPKSVGGPGNIEENLIPIGLSLNRYKSNSIPSALFKHATGNLKGELSKEQRRSEPKLYFRNRASKALAKRIVAEINRRPIDEARDVYLQIREFHYPNT